MSDPHVPGLSQEDISSTVGDEYDEAHYGEGQVVMPAGGLLSPKSGVPFCDLLIDSSEHNQDQPDGGELLKYAEDDSQAAGYFGQSEEDGEAFAHAYALTTLVGFSDMAPAAGEEDNASHEAEEKQAKIGEAEKLR